MKTSRLMKLKQKGLAAVESVIVIPIFLLLVVGIFELTMVMHANHIVISLSREAGNIVSRSSTDSPQDIMDTMALASGDLDLTQDGAMYITSVVGQSSGDDPYVSEQVRWGNAGIPENSDIWSGCSTWVNDVCDLPESKQTISNLGMTLAEGESVYVVEVMYRYSSVYDLLFDGDIVLSDTTYM
ncbi:TadE/TadG family type IV pilus assembly protein [Vibrio maerlii]|uniref:TadE/TadG family type IV pilus assembly protein n=1 Tax=Vibrio maerlii TaxID=2231648 RepID=UPI000E3BC627|nr:TadE/TadG family type IV pilus assembly protein [Vibrio maerlii]